MITLSTWVLLCLFAICVGAGMLLEAFVRHKHKPSAEDDPDFPPDMNVQTFEISSEQMTKLLAAVSAVAETPCVRNMEVALTWTLSTGHLAEEDTRKLSGFTGVETDMYTFRVFVAEFEEKNLALLHSSFKRIYDIAQALDIDYIVFDSDGPVHSELQSFDW